MHRCKNVYQKQKLEGICLSAKYSQKKFDVELTNF